MPKPVKKVTVVPQCNGDELYLIKIGVNLAGEQIQVESRYCNKWYGNYSESPTTSSKTDRRDTCRGSEPVIWSQACSQSFDQELWSLQGRGELWKLQMMVMRQKQRRSLRECQEDCLNAPRLFSTCGMSTSLVWVAASQPKISVSLREGKQRVYTSIGRCLGMWWSSWRMQVIWAKWQLTKSTHAMGGIQV